MPVRTRHRLGIRRFECVGCPFNEICVHTCLSINKTKRMIHCLMLKSNVPSQRSITFPAVRVNNRARRNMAIDNTVKGLCASFSTATMKTSLSEVLSTPSTTYIPSTLCLLLYLRFPSFYSSTSTMTPSPPITLCSSLSAGETKSGKCL